MGWLDLGLTAEQRKDYARYNHLIRRKCIGPVAVGKTFTPKRARVGKQKNAPVKAEEDRKPEVATAVQQGTRITSLPKELVERIFIYSGNLQFAFTSRAIMAKLCPSYYLESHFVRAQLMHDGTAPLSVLSLPFLTKELLKSLKIKNFERMIVPEVLVKSTRPDSEDIIIYLLHCGCSVDDGATLYQRFLTSDSKGIKRLIKRNVPASQQNVHQAVAMRSKYAAAMAKTMTHLDDQGLSEIWTFSQEQGATDVIEQLSQRI